VAAIMNDDPLGDNLLDLDDGPRSRQGTFHLPNRRSFFRSCYKSLMLHGVTLIAVATVVFVLPRAMPGDPLSALEDPDSSFYITDPELRSHLLAYYGLDRPLPDQYVRYLKSIARGDFGWSIARKVPVASLIQEHLPWTLLLMFVALTLAALLSYVAGIEAAWRRGEARDYFVLVTMTAIRAIPEYALAVLFLIGFAVVLPLFPLYGGHTPFMTYDSWFGKIADVAYHLVLPATTLTLSLLGTKFLLMRNTMISSLGEDYMLLARAKGLPDRLLKYRHAGRNALLPFLTLIGIQSGIAAGGSVFVEAVFAYPGMGSLILKAVEARDYPVLEAAFLVFGGFVIAINLIVDLLYQRLDPRAYGE
jgi:peptide/nickel transport system permease protein